MWVILHLSPPLHQINLHFSWPCSAQRLVYGVYHTGSLALWLHVGLSQWEVKSFKEMFGIERDQGVLPPLPLFLALPLFLGGPDCMPLGPQLLCGGPFSMASALIRFQSYCFFPLTLQAQER